jgi:hypothetical protein
MLLATFDVYNVAKGNRWSTIVGLPPQVAVAISRTVTLHHTSTAKNVPVIVHLFTYNYEIR